MHAGGISQNENGLRAAQSSILARRNAYFRRRGTTKENLSAGEYREMMMTYYLRESFFYRNHNRGKCNQLLAEALRRFPGIIARKEFWSITLRNNLSFL
jgi:hypothetical protein